MVKSDRNDKIFGDTSRVDRDVRPTYGKTKSKTKTEAPLKKKRRPIPVEVEAPIRRKKKVRPPVSEAPVKKKKVRAVVPEAPVRKKVRSTPLRKKLAIKPSKPRRARDMNVINDLNIHYDTASIPPDGKHLDPGQIHNMVKVPERLLMLMRSNAETRSQSYSKFLMEDVMPLVMSLDAGNKFVQTALLDGVGLDIDIDGSMGEAIQNLIRMDTIVFYLKRLKLPSQYKRKFLDRLVEVMAEDCVIRMSQHKRPASERFVKDLEGIVVRGRTKEVDEQIQNRIEARRNIKKALEPSATPGKRIVQDSGIRSPGAARRRSE